MTAEIIDCKTGKPVEEKLSCTFCGKPKTPTNPVVTSMNEDDTQVLAVICYKCTEKFKEFVK